MQPPFRHGGLPLHAQTRHDPVFAGDQTTMSETKRIGFIGLGNMGTPMAANLVRGGHEVMAYDISGARARQFAQAHAARATDTLADLAGHAEIVITMLPTSREVREALVEAQGGALAANLHRGAI